MKFKLDENLGTIGKSLFEANGHDVATVAEQGLSGVEDAPEARQEAIAGLIFEEIAAERAWDERFASTQGEPGELVRRAQAEAQNGDVLPCDPSDRPQR